MAGHGQTLEALVRNELRGPVSELVRQVVVELVHERLNGRAPDAEMAALGAQVPSRATSGAAAAPDPSGELRHCNGCDRDLPAGSFSPGHYRCKECRRRDWRERAKRRREEPAEEPPRPESGA